MVSDHGTAELVARSLAMREVQRQVELVRDSSTPVLITGERGTGKEFVARTIHRTGNRRREPFVQVDCGSVPHEVLAKLVFGAQEPGRYELAGGGTLYLEDVGALPQDLQERLLRALLEGNVERVGTKRLASVRARLIVSSRDDLRNVVRDGRFREDLFRRLSLFPIALPPLRQRREDVPALAQVFLERHKAEKVPPARGIETRALQALQAQEWPGNARELEVVVLNAILDSGEDGVVRCASLPAPMRASAPPAGDSGVATVAGAPAPESGGDQIVPLEELERRAIIHALRVTGGNVTRAARALGIGRATMYRKLERFRITSPS